MTWHIVSQIGRGDTFMPPIRDDEPRVIAVFGRTDDRWYVRNNASSTITDVFCRELRPEAEDLLHLAMSVYTADLRAPRDRAVDRWSRDFRLYVPVLNEPLWNNSREHLERTLAFLTGDRWAIQFRGRPPGDVWAGRQRPAPGRLDKVCLFSGGLDSLIGAIDLLSAGASVGLVGHHGAGVTNSYQKQTLSSLGRVYGELMTPFMFHAQPPKQNAKTGEPSMRARSFLFFAMGTAVSTAAGNGIPLVVAENGFISLNIPLTPSRAGSSSTRTTHPHYVSLYSELLERLGLDVPIELPYRFATKGEMLTQCASRSRELLLETTPLTMSCSHAESGRFRDVSPKDHCGYCVPCIIRRASTVAAGVPDGHYGVDVRTARPDFRTDTGRDVRAFEMAVERAASLTIDAAVFKILGPGPLPPEDVTRYADMYLRGLAEVRDFLKGSI